MADRVSILDLCQLLNPSGSSNVEISTTISHLQCLEIVKNSINAHEHALSLLRFVCGMEVSFCHEDVNDKSADALTHLRTPSTPKEVIVLQLISLAKENLIINFPRLTSHHLEVILKNLLSFVAECKSLPSWDMYLKRSFAALIATVCVPLKKADLLPIIVNIKKASEVIACNINDIQVAKGAFAVCCVYFDVMNELAECCNQMLEVLKTTTIKHKKNVGQFLAENVSEVILALRRVLDLIEGNPSLQMPAAYFARYGLRIVR